MCPWNGECKMGCNHGGEREGLELGAPLTPTAWAVPLLTPTFPARHGVHLLGFDGACREKVQSYARRRSTARAAGGHVQWAGAQSQVKKGRPQQRTGNCHPRQVGDDCPPS